MRESWDSNWRQGSVLAESSFSSLRPDAAPQLAVAVSHSCDIAQIGVKEPTVEFIAVRLLENCDGNFTQAKNPRTLDLEVTVQGVKKCLRFVATEKFLIAKAELVHHQPDDSYQLPVSAVMILREWLSSRYDRQAFPDALNARLRPLVKLLEKEGAKRAEAVLGFWMDYQPRDEELRSDDSYGLSVFVVYSVDDPKFAEAAEGLATIIEQCLQGIDGLELVDCRAYSEYEFTVGDIRKNVQYRLDYVSFRKEPHGPTV